MNDLIINQGLYISGLLAIYFWFAMPSQSETGLSAPLRTRDVEEAGWIECEYRQLGSNE